VSRLFFCWLDAVWHTSRSIANEHSEVMVRGWMLADELVALVDFCDSLGAPGNLDVLP
jgi:hypothetical protein